jgi:acyl-CoA synthetase (AMP-forming)/AMP-acid ligase II
MPDNRLVDMFAALVRQDPDRIVLYDGDGGVSNPQPLTRRQLSDLALDLRSSFEDLSVGPGDCVGVWLPNWSSSIAAQLAAASLGAHVVGINTRYTSEEVGHVLVMARPRVLLVAHDFHKLDLAGRLRKSLITPGAEAPHVIVVPAPAANGPADVDTYDVGAGAQALVQGVGIGQLSSHHMPGLCVAFTTSGSTGRPKLAAHDEVGVVTQSLSVAAAADMHAGDVLLSALPLAGVFGFAPAMAALLAGASVLLEPVFDAPGVLKDMATCHVTHAAGADDIFGRLLEARRGSHAPLSLRWLGIADFEGHSRQVAARAETELGCTVVGVYGSSEVFALAAFWDAEDPEDLRWSGGGHLVTRDTSVRVADPVSGEEVGRGGEGEIQFKGPGVVNAYLGAPSSFEAAFTHDGWFRTGDLGRLLDERTLAYKCRMGDVLRLRGFLVDPSEIEFRLVAHPEVALAKVVGVRGAVGGGTVAVGFVVAREGSVLDGEALRDWCAEALAVFKVPKEIFMLSALPTTSGTNGSKVRAADLRALASQRLGLPITQE